MELGLAADRVDGPEGSPGPDFLAAFDRNVFHLAVEGEIFTVLDKDALVVSGDDDDLVDGSVEHGLDGSAGIDRDGHAVVEGHLDIFVDRMVVGAEPFDHRSGYRPWQAPLVGGEFRIQPGIDGGAGALG